MIGWLLCMFFGFHDWKMYVRNEIGGRTAIVFICPRCNSYHTFTVDKWEDLHNYKKKNVEYEETVNK